MVQRSLLTLFALLCLIGMPTMTHAATTVTVTAKLTGTPKPSSSANPLYLVLLVRSGNGIERQMFKSWISGDTHSLSLYVNDPAPYQVRVVLVEKKSNEYYVIMQSDTKTYQANLLLNLTESPITATGPERLVVTSAGSWLLILALISGLAVLGLGFWRYRLQIPGRTRLA